MPFLKLASIAVIAFCALAVWVARSAPRSVRFRAFHDAHAVPIDGVFLTVGDQAPWLLDTATGELSRMPLPADQRLHGAALSDWIDEDDQRQVIGQWVAYGRSGDRTLAEQFGLARISFPGGQLLGRVADAPVLAAPPCWYPGPRPRALFAAMDGKLYQCTFPDERSSASQTPVVKPVNWSPTARRLSNPFVIAPVWPKVPALGGRLIAEIADSAERGHFKSTRLWWLRLTADGTTVAEIGPLSVAEPGGTDNTWECLPSAAALPDGGCLLAYQRVTDRGSTRDLLVVRAKIDPATGEPTFRPSDARKIATGVASWAAAFSPDAAWVYVVEGLPERQGATLRRIPVGLGTSVSHETIVRVR